MQKRLKLAVIALCCSSFGFAQNTQTTTNTDEQAAVSTDESAFTFTEAQLDENEGMSQNVTLINSNNNFYAGKVGFLFSPARFRYRAFNQKFNDVYINGVYMNDMETGQFGYSAIVGGLNHQTREVEFALPFEDNHFSMSGMAGSNNYNFRPAKMPTGHKLTLTGANRSYTLRGIYSYNSGLNEKGWAVSAGVGYRWSKEGYVEGTFYNSLSYFLGIQKLIGDSHSLSFMTWGSPTERGQQTGSTDEMYWIANNNQYNPNWGYHNGKKRNSRVITNFTPSAMLTWDWQIDDATKLTVSLLGQYGMDKRTRLNYNNTDNPAPDYYKLMPSNSYDVWTHMDRYTQPWNLSDWNAAFNYLSASKENRQLNWDKMYQANQQMNALGQEAMYYQYARRIDNLRLALAAVLNKQITPNIKWNVGLNFGTNNARHYQTMEDLLGANKFSNINTYALGRYSLNDPQVYYDYDPANPTAVSQVGKGDVFGYDYRLYTNKGWLWSSYIQNVGPLHYSVSGKIGFSTMQRNGKMRNGMAVEYSKGKSGTAKFLEGGFKVGSTLNIGAGHAATFGIGYEVRAPQASTAFVSPEVNNDFVTDLKLEKIFSMELGYQFQCPWLLANINGYYSTIKDATEWQVFYFDDINSLSYVSMSGINKHYYGVELGAKVKMTSYLDLNLIGTISDAKNTNNATAWYMSSTTGTYNDDNDHKAQIVYNKDMRESGTPLTALSAGLSFHSHGWYIDLIGNYYDRIYLSYSPSYRYASTLNKRQELYGDVYDENGEIRESALAQAKGKGGFMLDGSIGKSIYLKKGMLSINFMISNILNNTKLCTGGWEQSRNDYSSSGNIRTYSFANNPKKFYAWGTNGMLNITYKF